MAQRPRFSKIVPGFSTAARSGLFTRRPLIVRVRVGMLSGVWSHRSDGEQYLDGSWSMVNSLERGTQHTVAESVCAPISRRKSSK